MSVSGGTVIGKNDGIYINTKDNVSGMVTVTGGTVTGERYGVNVSGSATLTMGTKDTSVNITSPVIESTGTTEGNGVFKGETATFNFYDGKVIAREGNSINRAENDKPDGYEVVKTNAEGKETAVLRSTYTIAYALDGGTAGAKAPTTGTCEVDVEISNPTKKGYVFTGWTADATAGLQENAKTGTTANPETSWTGTATTNTYFKNLRNERGTVTLTANWEVSYYENVDTGAYYQTLAEALEEVANNQTIKVLNSKTETTAPELATGKTGIKLDMNGQTTTLNNVALTNNGGLDIYNSSVAEGKLTGSGTRTIINAGTLTTNNTSSTNRLSIENTSTAPTTRIIYNNSGKTATLNTNTYITYTNAIVQPETAENRATITNRGALTVQGATITNTITGKNYDEGILNIETGRMIITSGTINTIGNAIYSTGTGTTTPAVEISGTTTSTAITSANASGIINNSTGTVQVNGGAITSSSLTAIVNSATGTITITEGTISGNEIAIANRSSGTINVTGGTITGGDYGIYNKVQGTINVSGNTTSITATTSNAICNESTGTINVTGGTITASSAGAIHNHVTGEVTVTGGTIAGGNYGMYNSGQGTIEVTGGTITGAHGIFNYGEGTINVSGNTTSITGTTHAAIRGYIGTVTVAGGTITGKTDGIYITTKENVSGTAIITGGTVTGEKNGVCVDDSATLTIGTKDTSVSITSPVIQSTGTTEGFGVNRDTDATFNFYDGKVIAREGNSINLAVNDKPDGYEVVKTNAEGKEIAVLRANYTIAYALDGGTAGAKAPTTGTCEVDVEISNPTKTGYIFTGWTTNATAGLGENAKTGTTANPETSWTGTATTNTYFKNLRNERGTVTLTANWEVTYYENVDTGAYYQTLAEALAEVANNQTIKVLNSKTETTAPTLAAGKTGVKLDMNGKTTTLNGVALTNNGELDIYNSSSAEGKITSSGTRTIVNAGTLTTNGTSSTNKLSIINTSADPNARVILNNENKNATLNTNTYLNFTTATTDYRHVVTTNGTLTVAGANIANNSGSASTGYDRGLQIGNSAGKITISSGTISTPGMAILVSNVTAGASASNAVEITGGTITSENDIAVYNNHTKNKIVISGGTITAKETHTILNHNTGEVIISGGKIETLVTRDTSTVRNEGGGKITITDGNIISTVSSAIVNQSGDFIITGGTITSSTTLPRGVGVNIKGGNVAITGGTITASYGILWTGDSENTGVVTLGKDDNQVDINSPVVTGELYKGVGVGRLTFNYYDGIIKGPEGKSIDGTIADKPDGYEVVKTTENGIETAVLRPNYTIAYAGMDGASHGTNHPTNATYEVDVEISNPTKTGYTFAGWTTNASAGLQENAKTGTTANPEASWTGTATTNTHFKNLRNGGGTVTLTATWTANTYKVVYYNGSTKLYESNHSYDTAKKLTKMSATETGWEFAGWSLANNTVTATYKDEASVSNLSPTNGATVNLYAVWKRTASFYSGNSTTATTVDQFKNGETLSVELPAPTTINGWTTLGWRDDTTAGAKEYGSATAVTLTENVGPNFYAVYSREVHFYSGTNKATDKKATQYHNSNGTTTGTYAVTVPSGTATITNWELDGWRTDLAAAAKTYNATGTITANASVFNAVYKRRYQAHFYSGLDNATDKPSYSNYAYYNTTQAANTLPTTVSIALLSADDSTNIAYSWEEIGWRKTQAAGDKEYDYGASATVEFGTNFYSVYKRKLTLEYRSHLE